MLSSVQSVTMQSVEVVTDETVAEMRQFLCLHEDYCLFLLGNLEVHGFKQTDAANSGNYYLVRSPTDLMGVFVLTLRGNLLIHLTHVTEGLFALIAHTLESEATQLKGLLGEWDAAQRLWEYFKQREFLQNEIMHDKSVLYTISLVDYAVQSPPNTRLLTAHDYAVWRPMRLAYLTELGLPHDLTEEQLRIDFLENATSKVIWGVFSEGQLVTIGNLNAKALDLGQVGGVYTTPSFRGRGLARRLMQRIFADCKALHRLRKLIIFTDIENRSARRVYESLGVTLTGHYGIFFGAD